jgi:hypothetical protein
LIAAAAVLLLVLSARACNVVAVSNEFPEADYQLGGRSFHIRPAAVVDRTGSKLGIPRYEMKDAFFINVSYKCSSKYDGLVEVVKGGSLASASDVYPSGTLCHMNFQSSSPMTGEFTIRFISAGNSHEKTISLKRRVTLMSPVWEMINSA